MRELWTVLRQLAAFAALLAVPAGVSAHGYKSKGLEIVHPWAMETAGKTASVYMKIASRAREPDRLVSVVSAIAENAAIADSGDASIGPPSGVREGLLIPAGAELELTKAGPHITLEGLTKPLNAYGRFALSLMFERAGRVDIEVMVEAAE